jgi:hypothetical protein
MKAAEVPLLGYGPPFEKLFTSVVRDVAEGALNEA